MLRVMLILAFAICESVFAADVIERVTVLGNDDLRGITTEQYGPQLRSISSAAPIDVGRGDQLILHAGKSGQYMITASDVRRSNFGNAIVRGKTPTGGKALLVISPTGFITGNFYQYDGKVMITTGKDGVVTAWREGIDALALPIDDGAVAPPSMNSRAMPVMEAEPVSSERAFRRQIMKSETQSGVRYPEYRAGASELSVLLYHDDTMVDPTGVADYLITLTDEIFLASEVALRLRIAGFISVPVQDDALHRDVHTLMSDARAPFTDIESELLSYEADVAILLRDTRSSEEPLCGLADNGVENGVRFAFGEKGVVEWRPQGNGKYCMDKTFAHELGHLLGATHHRADPYLGAYSYSFGYKSDAVATVMVPGDAADPSLYINKFSNPRLDCEDDRCGIESNEANSADNVKTLLNTAPIVADGSKFNADNVTPYRYEYELSSCEKDGLEGLFEGTGIYNQTKYDLSVQSHHLIRGDGTSYVKEFDRGELVLKASYRTGWGWCVTAENESALRTEYVETFTRYYHPTTGEIVELGHLHWEEGYQGQYSLIHIAKTNGGSFAGHPEQSVKVGAEYEVQYEPDYGYELSELRTSCDGTRSGNSFVVTTTADDCRLELIFARNEAEAETATAFIERFYTNILGRVSDPGGLNAWLNVINTQSAAAVALGFLNSVEFLNKNLDDYAFVDTLYRTLFDREGDAVGAAAWIDQLGAGKLREMVIWGFLRSAEFKNLAGSFSVTALSAADESSYGIRAFTERFYTVVLGRHPDQAGFDGWVTALSAQTLSGGDLAKAFFLSAEYVAQETSDSEFVETAYEAFFGRAADSAGKENWLNVLAQGQSREFVLDGFVGSAEFAALASFYGIKAS